MVVSFSCPLSLGPLLSIISLSVTVLTIGWLLSRSFSVLLGPEVIPSLLSSSSSPFFPVFFVSRVPVDPDDAIVEFGFGDEFDSISSIFVGLKSE